MADGKQTHMIRRQVFDLHVDDEDQAKSLQNLISRIFSTRLSPLIESVLDEFSHPDELISIQRLDIDVGKLSPDKFETQLEERIIQALRQALATSVSSGKSLIPLRGLHSAQKVSIVQAKLDLLIHFLQFGYLSPWARGRQIEIPKLMEELLEEEPKALVHRLRQIPNLDQAIPRLIEQFPEPIVDRVINILISPVSEISLVRDTRQNLEKVFIKLPGRKGNLLEFRRQMSYRLFDYFLRPTTANNGVKPTELLVELSQSIVPSMDQKSKDHFFRALIADPHQFVPQIQAHQIPEYRQQIRDLSQGSEQSGELEPDSTAFSIDFVEEREELQTTPSQRSIQTTSSSFSSPSPTVEETLNPEAQLDLIIVYLIQQEWPWWAPEELRPSVPNEMLLELMNNQPSLVRQKLEENLFQTTGNIRSNGTQLSQVLASELSNEAQIQLVDLIYPSFSGFILLLIRFFEESFEAEEKVIQAVWQSIWRTKMASPGQALKITDLFHLLIPSMADLHQSSPKEESKTLLKKVMERVGRGESRFLSIQSGLMEYAQQQTQVTSISPEKKEEEADKEFESKSEKIEEQSVQRGPDKEEQKREEKESQQETISKEITSPRRQERTDLTSESSPKAEEKKSSLPPQSKKKTEKDISEQSKDITEQSDIEKKEQAKKKNLETEAKEETPPVSEKQTNVRRGKTENENKKEISESQENLISGDKGKNKTKDESGLERKEKEIDPQDISIPFPENEKELTALSLTIQLDPEDKDAIKQEMRLFSYFMRNGSFLPDSGMGRKEDFERRLLRLMEAVPREMGNLVGKMLYVPQNRQRFISAFSDDMFEKLLTLLPGIQASDLLEHYQEFRILTEPHQELLPVDIVKQELLHYLIASQSRTPVPYQYISRVIKRVVRDQGQAAGKTLLSSLNETVTSASLPQLTFRKELEGIFTLIDKEWKDRPHSIQQSEEPVRRKRQPLGDMPIDISNAGLILVWPFIPHYFKMLEMLTPKRQFIDEAKQKRAVHLLQYVVRKSTSDPEDQLALNKLMCGLPLAEPIEQAIDITEKEAETAEGLLGAACAQWKAMKNGTPDGLRGSFLIREGSLEKKLKNWELKVEKKAFDMLLDHLPWSISMVKFPWMDSMIQVEWR